MQINISEGSWHYRVYAWWKKFDRFEKDRDFHENLCHYMRVVLIWAPLGWFFQKPILGGKLRPFIIWAAMMAVIGTAAGAFISPTTTVMFWLLYTLVLILGTLLFYLFRWVLIHIDGVSIVFAALLFPFWGSFLWAAWVVAKLWDKFVEPIWFSSHRYIKLVRALTIAALFASFYILWGVPGLQLLLFFIGMTILILAIAAVCVIVVYGIVEGIPLLSKWLRQRFSHSRVQPNTTRQHSPKRKGSTTRQLLATYRRTKWGRLICPYINLPHQW